VPKVLTTKILKDVSNPYNQMIIYQNLSTTIEKLKIPFPKITSFDNQKTWHHGKDIHNVYLFLGPTPRHYLLAKLCRAPRTSTI